METVVRTLLENFCITMFVVGLSAALLNTIIARGTPQGRFSEQFFRWFSFFAIGVTGLFTFFGHVFMPETSAANIGWPDSPFQYEVGIADLTVGVLGLLAFRRDLGFRLAATIAVVCWLGGDAVGHVHQMISAHNFAPGNAGSWFWTDVLFPILMVASYWISSRNSPVLARSAS